MRHVNGLCMMRCLLWAVAFILTLQIILTFSSSYEAEDELKKEGLLSRLCVFLENGVGGDEGRGVADEELQLIGLAVVFRHGERSPLLTGPSSLSCAPHRPSDRETYQLYRKLVDSEGFSDFLHVDEAFSDYRRYPERWECSTGNMTAEGALQLSQLGHFFRSRYSKTSLFSLEARVNASIVSSTLSRTFQSAIAFASAFLFPLRNIVHHVNLMSSNWSFLCREKSCDCPVAYDWRLQYEKELVQFFLNDSSAELREKAARIFSNLSSTRGILEPFLMMDVILGRYACRRSPLPCASNGECVTVELLAQLLNETTRRGDVMYRLMRNESISKRLQTAESQPVLQAVAEMGDRLQAFPHSHLIRLFSGHDSTVGPILRTLGLSFVDFPHYTSRIVFELYWRRDSASSPVSSSPYSRKLRSPALTSSILIRVLYNGVDRTQDMRFCSHSLFRGLCPLSVFTNYALNETIRNSGFENVPDLCDETDS